MQIFNQPIIGSKKACRPGPDIQLFFRPNIRIGKKCDLSDFDRGMIVVAWQGGLSISETADPLGFSHATVSREYEKQKTSSGQQFCGQTHIVIERGQRRRARGVKAERKITVTQITTHYSSKNKPNKLYIGNLRPELNCMVTVHQKDYYVNTCIIYHLWLLYNYWYNTLSFQAKNSTAVSIFLTWHVKKYILQYAYDNFMIVS